MSSTKSVQKRIRQSKKANFRNRHYKSMMKTAVKRAMDVKDKDEANILVNNAISTIDKISGKGIIHKNNAAHQKSKLMKHLNNL